LFERAFTPTQNRRLNELIGFLLLASALLLFLALATYSPLDPSLNTSAAHAPVNPARNWVGMVGALFSDLLLQLLGVSAFLLPVMLGLAATRWFHSRPVNSPVAKAAGGVALTIFVPALLALLPWQWRWLGAVPIEGLLGRILGDVLVRYLNVAGAYIVALSVIAVALYLSTAFSFGALRLWMETRFAFGFAAWERWEDWRKERAAARAQSEMERRRRAQAAAAAAAQTAQQRRVVTPPSPVPQKPQATPAAAPASAVPRTVPLPAATSSSSSEPHLGARADSAVKTKTTLPRISGGFKLPSSSLLHRPEDQFAVDENELRDWAQVLTEKSAEFDVHGQVTHINPGPVVTTFEFKPDAGIKVSRITNLADDLCLALKAESILIERMPGKSTVGVQVPNRERETIWLREGIESQEFAASKSRLTLSMGKDINGRLVTADLTTMPHLLIAGATGTGKSVAINAMIMSMLYKATPDQVRFILIDPKRLELGIYEGVPHLYTPIITEAKLAAHVLRNACREMERRLKLLAERSVRNIEQYNRQFGDDHTPSLFEKPDDEHRPLPYIVIIIDELADLMMIDRTNVEESVTRLAQMARAVGIHLVLATQRPSVDVITGLIKANFPARISFRVAT
ncbi:MAG: DNA translocase FtsK 4TM domain-containing protein, partial [Terriglobales bacterium]